MIDLKAKLKTKLEKRYIEKKGLLILKPDQWNESEKTKLKAGLEAIDGQTKRLKALPGDDKIELILTLIEVETGLNRWEIERIRETGNPVGYLKDISEKQTNDVLILTVENIINVFSKYADELPEYKKIPGRVK